jgi:hypothetical protein
VVNNADDVDFFFGTEQSKGILDYLPESETGMVVYTTRTLEMAEPPVCDYFLLLIADVQGLAHLSSNISLRRHDNTSNN